MVPNWAPKIIYFFNSGTNASIMRYDVVYFDKLGIDPDEMGILKALGPIMSFFGSFLLARLADNTGRHRFVLVLSMLVCVLGYLSFLLKAVYSRFFLLAIVVCINGICSAAFAPLVDSFVLKVCELNKSSYGSQRLWAAVGWGICGLLTGQAIELWGEGSMFTIYAVGSCINLVLVWLVYKGPSEMDQMEARQFSKLPKDISLTTDELDLGVGSPACDEKRQANITIPQSEGVFPPPAKHEAEDGIISAALEAPAAGLTTAPTLFESRWLLSVLVLDMFFYGAGAAVVEQFLFLYIGRELNGGPGLMGAALFVMTASEVPFFTIADRWIKRFGYVPIFVGCHVTFAFRVWGYTCIPAEHNWLVLLLEPLHGISFALMWTASVQVAQDIAPKGREATYQGLIGGVHFGLGLGVGSAVAGWIWAEYGATKLYHAAGWMVLMVGIALFFLWPSGDVRRFALTPAFPSILGGAKEDLTEDFVNVASLTPKDNGELQKPSLIVPESTVLGRRKSIDEEVDTYLH